MPSLHGVYFVVHDLILISLSCRLQALYRLSLLTIPNFGELKLLRRRRAFRNPQQFSLRLFSNPLFEVFAVPTPLNTA